MSLEGMTEEQLQTYENGLLGLVPKDGTGVGNTSLIHRLAWEDWLYWTIRDRLIDRGVLTLGRGRGGSVKLAVPPILPVPPVEVAVTTPVALPSTPTAPLVPARRPEEELYEPVARVLRDHWARDKRYDQHIVEITARQGARQTGGRWSRPDLVMASLTTYPYVPGKHFDVTTFEVKPHDTMDVTAVYEALAHLRTATRAYVLLWVPDDLVETYEETIGLLGEEAERHGVGVLVVGDESNYETWEERVEARRLEPDPEKLNDFLSKQVSPYFKEQIIKWYR